MRVVSKKKIEKKDLTAAVTGRAGINYHLCCRRQRTQNSKWRIRRKTRDWSPSCSANWRKYKTDMTLPLQWRMMKIKNARTIENRTYSTSPGQKNGPAHDPARRILGVYEGKYVNPKDPHALKDTSSAKRNEKAAKC